MDQADNILEMGEKPELKGEAIEEGLTAQEVTITQSGVHNVRGIHVTLRQAGAHTVNADHLVIRQGGVLKAEADRLEVTQGGLVAAKTQSVDLKASLATLVVAEGDTRLDQSGAQILVAKGNVAMDQSGAVVMVSKTVRAENSGAVFLIAREVEGNIQTTFGPKESLIFGAAAGIVTGLTLFLFRLLNRSR